MKWIIIPANDDHDTQLHITEIDDTEQLFSIVKLLEGWYFRFNVRYGYSISFAHEAIGAKSAISGARMKTFVLIQVAGCNKGPQGVYWNDLYIEFDPHDRLEEFFDWWRNYAELILMVKEGL